MPSVKYSKRPQLLVILLFLAAALYVWVNKTYTSSDTISSKALTALNLYKLPQNLEEEVLRRFDTFVASGIIFYDHGTPEIINDNGFELEIRAIRMLKTKPVTGALDPGRTKAGGPFTRLQPKEIITQVGPSHNLILNKYCIARPMLVLPTIKYAKQSDDLNLEDISAAWSVLRAFKTPQTIIYNCGVNSGSSQGHKHLQLFPLADAIHLFPSYASSETDIETAIPHVPFKHFVLRIPTDADAVDVYARYTKLLGHTKRALIQAGVSPDYNVIMTAEWIVLVPRRTAYDGGPWGANAAGMVGLVAVRDEGEVQQWKDLGLTRYLTHLGIPRD